MRGGYFEGTLKKKSYLVQAISQALKKRFLMKCYFNMKNVSSARSSYHWCVPNMTHLIHISFLVLNICFVSWKLIYLKYKNDSNDKSIRVETINYNQYRCGVFKLLK